MPIWYPMNESMCFRTKTNRAKEIWVPLFLDETRYTYGKDRWRFYTIVNYANRKTFHRDDLIIASYDFILARYEKEKLIFKDSLGDTFNYAANKRIDRIESVLDNWIEQNKIKRYYQEDWYVEHRQRLANIWRKQ